MQSLKATMRHHHELPFGAEVLTDGVRFRLWAPRATAVSLQLEVADTGALSMDREPRGWFSLTTDRAGPGTRYRYVVDDRVFPDPASRYQPDGVHGPSQVVDARAHDWSDLGWRGRRWEEIVLYELHVGAFSATGDFAGATLHLDHIVELGATAVELMPVAAFPGERDWGYNGAFLYAPAARYGRPEALKRLVEACHERGLAIFLDVVYNHFGPEGNYLSAIAPDFFTDRHRTPWGAAIDFSGPNRAPIREFFINNAIYWLEEFQFDGLRFDAVHAIFDDSEPDIINEMAQVIRRHISDREIHLVLENDRNQAHYLGRKDSRVLRYDAQWNDDFHHALHVIVTDDTAGYYADFAARPVEFLGRALAEGLAYQGEPSPFRGGAPRGEPSAELPPTAFVGFLQNHDQVGNQPFGTRVAARVEDALLHAGIAIVLLSPQIPLLFMGEEWASVRPFMFFCDFEPGLRDAVREGRRREFAHFPAFQDANARERIPDPTALATFETSRLDWAEIREESHSKWLARYRQLLSIRAREIVPRLAGIPPFAGSYQVLGAKAVGVEWRMGDRSRLYLLANFTEIAVPIPVSLVEEPVIYSSAEPGAPRSATFFLSSPLS
jgi:maltooligosyltrehalose trehalohydrolase